MCTYVCYREPGVVYQIPPLGVLNFCQLALSWPMSVIDLLVGSERMPSWPLRKNKSIKELSVPVPLSSRYFSLPWGSGSRNSLEKETTRSTRLTAWVHRAKDNSRWLLTIRFIYERKWINTSDLIIRWLLTYVSRLIRLPYIPLNHFSLMTWHF